MNKSEFRKLIREEIRKIVREAKGGSTTKLDPNSTYVCKVNLEHGEGVTGMKKVMGDPLSVAQKLKKGNQRILKVDNNTYLIELSDVRMILVGKPSSRNQYMVNFWKEYEKDPQSGMNAAGAIYTLYIDDKFKALEAEAEAMALVIDEDGDFIQKDLASYFEDDAMGWTMGPKISATRAAKYPTTYEAWMYAPDKAESENAKWIKAISAMSATSDFYDLLGDGGEAIFLAAIPKGDKIADFIPDSEDEDDF